MGTKYIFYTYMEPLGLSAWNAPMHDALRSATSTERPNLHTELHSNPGSLNWRLSQSNCEPCPRRTWSQHSPFKWTVVHLDYILHLKHRMQPEPDVGAVLPNLRGLLAILMPHMLRFRLTVCQWNVPPGLGLSAWSLVSRLEKGR